MIGDSTIVVDPDEDGQTLAQYLEMAPRLSQAVFCLSVLEHVDDLDHFCYLLSCLVAPGGLLFLTFDYCDDRHDAYPVDIYHFHWMRKRTFNAYALGQGVMRPLQAQGFATLGFSLQGSIDYTWRGAHVYDYTFGSLALVKRA
jgi:hypothetical protein